MSDEEHEELVRRLARIYSWLKKGKKLAKSMGNFMERTSETFKNRVLALYSTSHFLDPHALIERLERRDDALTMAAVLVGALLVYLLVSWADDDDAAAEEEEGRLTGLSSWGVFRHPHSAT
jgi:hypothetical protein